MVWRAEDPMCNESKKTVWRAAPYLRGRGLDLGAGDFKILPHAISVDNMHHKEFGFSIKPDVLCDVTKLDIFGSQSMDFVYSSHTLEHVIDYKSTLKEWWRVVKQGGHLVLYLPDEDEYPKMGTVGANPDHKWDVSYDKVITAMNDIRGWDLIDFQKCNADMEYSLFFVFKKTSGGQNKLSYLNPKPEKTACVVRYGAFGDLMQASSVFYALKHAGYHTTVFTSLPGSDVITHDPNIDKLVLFDKDQVPNANLGDFWRWQRKNFDKFVNLSESVEGTLLSLPDRIQASFPPRVRHLTMNHNYVEFQHKIADVPYDLRVRFFETDTEREWAEKTRRKMGTVGPIVLWSLAGSSVHKTWAGLDSIIANFMLKYPECRVILVGSPECQILEQGWENEPRVIKKSGVWTIRETLSFMKKCNIIIGPETGVLNAAACEPMPKVVLLSHSTHENLTRDWRNTFPVWSVNTQCPGRGLNETPACHMLHYSWDRCKMDEDTGTAQCQRDIEPSAVWSVIEQAMLSSADRRTLDVKSEVQEYV